MCARPANSRLDIVYKLREAYPRRKAVIDGYDGVAVLYRADNAVKRAKPLCTKVPAAPVDVKYHGQGLLRFVRQINVQLLLRQRSVLHVKDLIFHARGIKFHRQSHFGEVGLRNVYYLTALIHFFILLLFTVCRLIVMY